MPLPDDYQVFPVGCAMLMFLVFQICLSLLKKGGVLNSHENLQFWQIAQPLLKPCSLLVLSPNYQSQGKVHLLTCEQ